jgi:hypothetical protein
MANTEYPLIKKLKMDLIDSQGGHVAVLAEQLESVLRQGRQAYGCGNERVGTITYGPELKSDATGWDISAIVLGIELIKKPKSIQELALETQALLVQRHDIPVKIETFIASVKVLLAEVLK